MLLDYSKISSIAAMAFSCKLGRTWAPFLDYVYITSAQTHGISGRFLWLNTLFIATLITWYSTLRCTCSSNEAKFVVLNSSCVAGNAL
jgi:hypothetical protein